MVACTVILGLTASCNQNKTYVRETPEELIEQENYSEISGITEIDKESLQKFDTHYDLSNLRSNSDSDNRNEAIAQAFLQMNEHLDGKFDRSKGEFIGFTIEENKELGKISIVSASIIRPNEIDPITTSILYALRIDFNNDNSGDAELRANESEKIEVSCEGGEADGKKKVVNRPRNKVEGAIVAKQVASLLEECLDGGGCIKVCTVSATIS